jgi:hypothetical protein
MLNITLEYITKLVAAILSDGGITARLDHLDTTIQADHAPSTGYMVSLPGFEKVVPLHSFSILHLSRYILTYGHHIVKPNRYLGAWVDDGKVYLDVSVNFSDRSTALAQGATWGQLAVWDVVNSTSIEVV